MHLAFYLVLFAVAVGLSTVALIPALVIACFAAAIALRKELLLIGGKLAAINAPRLRPQPMAVAEPGDAS